MNMATLRVEGEVVTPRQFSFEDLAALPHQIPDISALGPGTARVCGAAASAAG